MTNVSAGRVFFCPSCGARYDVPRELFTPPSTSGDIEGAPATSVVLLCGMCGHAARTVASALDPAVPVADRPPTAAELSLIESKLPRVVVGHEVPAAARSIAGVLRGAGYSPLCVKSGELVLSACDPAMPAQPVAVVLDVAIPGVLAFEVIEHLRAHPKTNGLPVILLASVFERTRYKRRPTNLYGADAYLELHHVPDRLAPVIEEVRAQRAPPPASSSSSSSSSAGAGAGAAPSGSGGGVQAPVERARAAGLRGRADVVDAEAATALARRLLSDVALYHGDELADGVRRGDPFASLAGAVDAARDMFRTALGVGAASGASASAAPGAETTAVFEDELARFGQQLLERNASGRGVPSGAGRGASGTGAGGASGTGAGG